MPLSQREFLIQKAIEARTSAHAPYSGYAVGAAVLSSEGNVFTGCNVEVASYGLTICAERNALFQAVAAGHKSIAAIAVATEDCASMCGACRQVLFEFGPKAAVYLTDNTGLWVETDIQSLLPDAFGDGD